MRGDSMGMTMLTWEGGGLASRRYTLTGEGWTGHLRFDGKLSNKAGGSVGDQAYDLVMKGLFRRAVIVTQRPYNQEMAVMRLGWRGGLLELTDGRQFRLSAAGALDRTWTFQDERGREMVSFRIPSIWKKRSEVRVSAGPERDRSVSLLLLAGWYAMALNPEQGCSV